MKSPNKKPAPALQGHPRPGRAQVSGERRHRPAPYVGGQVQAQSTRLCSRFIDLQSLARCGKPCQESQLHRWGKRILNSMAVTPAKPGVQICLGTRFSGRTYVSGYWIAVFTWITGRMRLSWIHRQDDSKVHSEPLMVPPELIEGSNPRAAPAGIFRQAQDERMPMDGVSLQSSGTADIGPLPIPLALGIIVYKFVFLCALRSRNHRTRRNSVRV